MKFAFLGAPGIGGPYMVYRRLREGLAAYGIDVQWVEFKSDWLKTVLDNPALSHERACGTVIAAEGDSEADKARALIDFLERSGFNGVFVNVLMNKIQMNSVRYLGHNILKLMIVHSITPGTYAAARSLRPHVHATIGVSARIRDDLVRWKGFTPDRTHIIANGVDTQKFANYERTPNWGTLRVLSLGRVEDMSKGIFWIPKIMKCLEGATVSLTIAGDGPDLTELQRRCSGLSNPIRFLGAIPPSVVPELLSKHDVLLFPSRFEGLGLTLVEAMAAGCVPVASRIRGVTDFVVTPGENGLLFSIGNVKSAAEHVRKLGDDRSLLFRMSAAARRSVHDSFSAESMCSAYASVIDSIQVAPPSIAAPLPMRDWRYPSGLKLGLRSYLPESLKNALRTLWAGISA